MGTPADDVSLYLRDHETAMRERLAELVEQNSFTDNAEGGRKVLAMLERTFAMPGLAGKRVPSTRFSDHLVLSTEGKKGASPIALVGHYDTVFPPGTFEGIRRDGELLRGPGVLDMKGGLVVVAYALRAVAETVGLDAIRAAPRGGSWPTRRWARPRGRGSSARPFATPRRASCSRPVERVIS
jgi:acetylornithine deacetylase/succinyl-diaminopimelate desuccinylase-like protein